MIDVDALVDEMLQTLPDALREDEMLRKKLVRIVAKHARETESIRKPRPRRRTPGLFDPMAVYRESPDDLRARLEALEIEALKDIVAEHGMDRSKLAMKWKSIERLVELILSTVASRTEKGDAFRKPGVDRTDEVQ